jgi:hypothetical protein
VTRQPADPLRLGYLIKAGAAHSMTGETYRSVGVRDAEIVAVSAAPDGLDDLAGGGTVLVDAGDLTLLPAFADSHEHLMEASRNTLLVPVSKARSMAEFTDLVSAAARDAAPDDWILTGIDWHESNLAENRLPTLAELDAAAGEHPVLARRGGHLRSPIRPRCGPPGSALTHPTHQAGRSGGWPTAAVTGCSRVGPCTRSRRLRPRGAGRSSRRPWEPAPPRTPRWEWARSARR